MGWIGLYDLVVKGGLLIDPAQGINEEMDLAVSSGRVEAVERGIPDGQAARIVDASGLIVTPGLVDIHTHVAHGLLRISVDPEKACLLKGCTTAVDAGSTGELLYPAFENFVIRRNRARVLAFLYFESLGMLDSGGGRFPEQKWAEVLTVLDGLFHPLFVNLDETAKLIRANRETIVGIKWAHRGLKSVELAREAADKAGCILMMENQHMPEALKYVKNGDILTHIYHHYFDPLAKPPRYDGLTEDGKIHHEFFDAVKRGVLLDVGHGAGSLAWDVAELALKEGLGPYTISTDLHAGCIDGPAYDLPTVMAKFLCLGMTVEEVVKATTENPATALSRLGEVGTLKPGACADVAVFKLQHGRFPLTDARYPESNEGRIGTQILTPVHVVRAGTVIV